MDLRQVRTSPWDAGARRVSKPSIAAYTSHDELALNTLLQAADISTEDITPEMLEHFLVAHLGKALVV